jgi:pimeloyl-ACP methyl ester carboxylesterase
MMLALDEHGTGPPLVLVHGLGTTRGVWREAARRLGRSHRVITIDLPGFGESEPAGQGFDLDEVAGAVSHAIEQVVTTAYDLLGHSLGGAVALTMACREPGRARRLVLSAPAGFRPRAGPVAEGIAALAPGLLQARRAIGSPLLENGIARRALLWGALHDASRISPYQAQLMLDASRGARRLREATRAALTADLANDLARVAVPVGFVWGTRDPLMPAATTASIRRCRPEAPVEVVAAAGHVAQLEQPALFTRAVERILSRLEDPVTVS